MLQVSKLNVPKYFIRKQNRILSFKISWISFVISFCLYQIHAQHIEKKYIYTRAFQVVIIFSNCPAGINFTPRFFAEIKFYPDITEQFAPAVCLCFYNLFLILLCKHTLNYFPPKWVEIILWEIFFTGKQDVGSTIEESRLAGMKPLT